MFSINKDGQVFTNGVRLGHVTYLSKADGATTKAALEAWKVGQIEFSDGTGDNRYKAQ